MGALNSLLSWLLGTILPLVLASLFVWGFIDALTRPERQFALASKTKNFWLAMLGGGGLIYLGVRVLNFRFALSGLLTFAFLIAVVYYLGPERSRMGARWNGRGGQAGRRRDRGPRGGW